MKRMTILTTLFLVSAIFLSACDGQTAATIGQVAAAQAPTQSQTATAVAPAPVTGAAPSVSGSGALDAFENVFQRVYQQVNPSVVNIQVATTVSLDDNDLPFEFFGGQEMGPRVQRGLGSGFVWDKEGRIVTNNHVVAGADRITVTFSDGFTVPGKVIGRDANSDLAVVEVDVDTDRLQPVTLADAAGVQVGQVAIAIGNPYGLSGTMTMGIISAVGRSISSDSTIAGSSYSIPDIIQTDAPINPGNSGGVLLNEDGQVIGVTAAIETSTGSNSGIGFAIPASIVRSVVPSLIENGNYQYAWLGISGASLTYELNQAMNLPDEQRGALVMEVTTNGPADNAGLQGSDNTTTLDGQEIQVGGDIITAIDGQAIQTFDDLVSYLVNRTRPGQAVTLTILRDGRQQSVEVTLMARPDASAQARAGADESGLAEPRQPSTPQAPAAGDVYLGISGASLSSEINQAMDLDDGQRGVLVQSVQDSSPAEDAGLQAGSETITVDGQSLTVGGDVITEVEGEAVSSVAELRQSLAQFEAGDVITLTILRDGQQIPVKVTLAGRPVQ